MKFTAYIENRFQELQLKQQSASDYDVVTDAQIKALHQILHSYRVALKWLLTPKLIYDYGRVCAGLDLPPEPVLLNKIKEQQDKKKPILAEVTPLSPLNDTEQGR